MKKTLIYISGCMVLLSAASCKKFLEKQPDNRASVTTPQQVSQLLATAYPQASYMVFCENLSDNVSDKGGGSQDVRTVTDPYNFQDVNDKEQDSPENYWFECYKAIAAANTALDAINNAEDTSLYRGQKGEALVCRAYAHFMLVTLFAKPYDQATASSDVGIPYVTARETVVLKDYDRRTVAYVYQQIEKDLLAGMPLINDANYTVPRYHFNKAATAAFAARFYLFKKEWQKVVDYANQVFAAGNVASMLRPWNTAYAGMTYLELSSTYAKATEPANLLLTEAASWWARNVYGQRYGLTQGKLAEIFSWNATFGELAQERQTYTVGGQENPLLPKFNEYFVRSSINAQIGVGYLMQPLFTAEEVLFNRAEALNELNQGTAAIEDMNTWATTRVRNYNRASHEIGAHMTAMYGANNLAARREMILDLKRIEYMSEGMRWFDILRQKWEVVHEFRQGNTLTGTKTLKADDKMRQLQLPQSVSTSGIPLNPR